MTPGNTWSSAGRKDSHENGTQGQYYRSDSPHEMHGPKEITATYHGVKRPTSGYDPYNGPTEYTGASYI